MTRFKNTKTDRRNKMALFILPTKEQFSQLMATDYKGPIYMINLLKFKPDGGVALYEKYGETCTAIWERIGLKLVLRTKSAPLTVIGGKTWDEVIIVWYPNVSAFIDMNRDKEYQANVRYRHEALTDSRLYLIRAEETDQSEIIKKMIKSN
jgi:uncharacterized protein (DUF1330 family)